MSPSRVSDAIPSAAIRARFTDHNWKLRLFLSAICAFAARLGRSVRGICAVETKPTLKPANFCGASLAQWRNTGGITMRLTAFVLSSLLIGAAAFAADPNSQTFTNDAGSSGMAEVKMSQLAVAQSQDAAVKRFAKMMIKDHSAANAKLTALAKQDKLTVPSAPTAAQESAESTLKGMTGKDFDRAYAAQMVKDHQAAVDLFRSAQADDQLSANLRAFAKKTLPTLEHHLKEAQELNDRLAKA
jgi:putative membrane protein